LLSTGNYSYSTFKTNREFFITGKDWEMLTVLEEIFQQDFSKNKFPIYHPNLVLSPFSSREKMEYLLKNAKKSLKIYTLNFWDESTKNIILQKAKEGIKIEMIFPDLKKVASNKDEIALFQKAWVQIKQIKKPEAHAKAILADDEYLYLWSINFSAPSMDQNREIGLVIKNKEIVQSFLEVFQKDF
jgi:phosphatidylserine/phosphatidylglycerophosphate/cardiolipin synthase-like enzyme